jgi:hypothetical protein
VNQWGFFSVNSKDSRERDRRCDLNRLEHDLATARPRDAAYRASRRRADGSIGGNGELGNRDAGSQSPAVIGTPARRVEVRMARADFTTLTFGAAVSLEVRNR